MVPPRAAEPVSSPEAAEFVRFCYRRRTVGWPELYDEMCAVASRGLFRGWGPADLAEHGIGFGLFELPALAALTFQVVAEEQAVRASERRTRLAERRTLPSSDGSASQSPSGTTETAVVPVRTAEVGNDLEDIPAIRIGSLALAG